MARKQAKTRPLVGVVMGSDSDLDVRDYGPEMPEHLADYGYTPENWPRYAVVFKLSTTLRYVGSPGGTGTSRVKAIKDLIRRMNRESNLRLRYEA
ncbi:hypothetical protein LCGC14_3118370 [marine sediment metagenome]|uniref:Uncharacterized protein n=1 Tax=marine sediment metagenome TaxID=412755 RepID=A0A0F8W3D5_9ZZZZ